MAASSLNESSKFRVMTLSRSIQSVTSLLLLLLLVQDGCHAIYRRNYCEYSELEVSSRRGVKIEPVSQSRIEISLPFDNGQRAQRMKNKFQIEFSFKTRSANGSLFYGRTTSHNNQLLALSLHNGRLIYTIRCPTVYADATVSTRDGSLLNDGKWHTVRYTVYKTPFGRNKIEIDDHPSAKRYEVSCAPITSIVLGGFSPRDMPYMGEFEELLGKFEGCIKKLSIPSPFRRPPKYYAVSVCE